MKRSATHQLLAQGQRVAMAAIALALLLGGFVSSWSTAQHILLDKGREHGTLTVTGCGERTCTGPYDPEGTAPPRTGMTIETSVAVKKGARLDVVVRPGTDEVIRTGWAGGLHAWLPLGGALVLAALILGGGLRLTRAAWATAAAGATLLLGAFLAL